MTKFGLNDKIIELINNYFKNIEQIKTVKIFGSRTTGTYRNGSDIDLVLYFNKEHQNNYNLISKIKYELDELNTPYQFDIIEYNSLTNQELINHINIYGKILYNK